MSAAFRSGLEHLHARRFLRARRDLLRAIAQAGAQRPWAMNELAQTFLRRGDVDQAEAVLRAALDGDDPLLHYGLGYLHRRCGRIDEARAALDRAATARPKLWAVVTEACWLEWMAGRSEAAEQQVARALRAMARTADEWGQSICYSILGTMALMQFRLRHALEHYDQAITLKEACGDRSGLVVTRHNQGLALLQLGRYRDALDAFYRGRFVNAELGDRAGEAHCWINIAASHLDLGEIDRAAAAFRKASRLFARLDDVVGRATCLHGLGYVARTRGQLGRSITSFQQALALVPVSTAIDVGGQILANLAQSWTETGRAEEAATALAQVPARVVAAGDPRTRVMLARERARAALALGDHVGAARHALGAIRLARRLPTVQQGLVPELAEAEAIRGRALLALGQARAAEGALARASARLEDLLQQETGVGARIGLLATNRIVHDGLIQAALRSRRPAARVWPIVARLKARELRRTIATGGGDGVHQGEMRECAAAIAALAARGELSGEERKRLQQLRDAYLEAFDRIRGDVAASGELDLAGIQSELGSDRAIVEYHVAADTTVALVATNSDCAIVDLHLPAQRLARSVAAVLGPLWKAASSASPGDWLAAYDPQAARRLATRLLGPLLPWLGQVRRLVVVPDGPLHQVPFELLLEALGDEAPVELAISIAPSSVLLQPTRRPRPATSVLAVAYSPPAVVRMQSAGEVLQLGPLPSAEAEASDVIRAVGRGEALTGRRATEQAVVERAPDHPVLHIVAHAWSDPLAPGLSGILLAGDGSDGASNGSQVLTADRVAALRLDRALVTLAACDSGRGRVRGPEGNLSLARAFLAVGAEAVVASLWPVDDSATAALMVEFYRKLAEDGNRARALAGARHRLRSVPATAHPFHWAPFVLIDRTIC